MTLEQIQHRNLAATAATLAAITLLATGCTPNVEAAPPQSTETTAHYDATPEADALPKVSDAANQLGTINPYPISTSYLANSIKPDAFDFLYNPYPDQEQTKEDYARLGKPRPPIEDLPDRDSAPLMDLRIGSDGTLRYKTYDERPGQYLNQNAKIMHAVADAAPVLEAAMQANVVGQAHIRIFEPNQFPGNPQWEPGQYGVHINHDYNDGGKPAVYYYLPADAQISPQALSLILSHEAGHGLTESREDIAPDPDVARAFTAACTTLRAQAAANMAQDGSLIESSLQTMRSMAPKVYDGAFNAVISAMRNGTYDQLPARYPFGNRSIPACFMQDPWHALADYVALHKVNGGKLPFASDAQYEDYFENESNEMVTDWNDLIKAKTIYGELCESGYLGNLPTDKEMGHSYDNILELKASTGNLILRVPDAFGENVADLPADQKAAVLTVAAQVTDYLRKHHATNKGLMDLVNKNYATFLAKAGVPSATMPR